MKEKKTFKDNKKFNLIDSLPDNGKKPENEMRRVYLVSLEGLSIDGERHVRECLGV